MIPPSLWLIALPIGAAPIVYLFRRVGVGGLVAACVALFSAWLTLRLPTGLEMAILGRAIQLDALSQITLTLLFITTAFLFLISSTTVPLIAGIRKRGVDIDILRGTGRTFYPVSLAILGFLVAASLSRHIGITAIFIEAAALSAVFIIQGSRLESTQAAQRFLVLISLATPLILLVSSRLDLYEITGSLPITNQKQAAFLAGIGFGLWLAVFPLHGWLTSTAAEAAPASTAFILTAFPGVAFLTLTRLISDAPWLINESPLGEAMIIAGVLTATVGGGLTAVQRGFNGLLGYAALYDLGCVLALFGLGGPAVVTLLLVGLVVRALALTLMAASLSAIRLETGNEGFSHLEGLATRLPLATGGVIIGGLTLAGTPLTLGFTLRWQLLQSLAEVNLVWPLFITIAGIGVMSGYLRGLYTLLPSAEAAAKPIQSRESRLLVVIIIVLSLACLLWGLFPEWLIAPLRVWVGGITVPI